MEKHNHLDFDSCIRKPIVCMLFEVKCRKMLIALFYGLRIAFTAFEMCSTHSKIEESLFVLQINCHSCRILRNGSYNNTQAFETLSNQMKLMQAKLVCGNDDAYRDHELRTKKRTEISGTNKLRNAKEFRLRAKNGLKKT